MVFGAGNHPDNKGVDMEKKIFVAMMAGKAINFCMAKDEKEARVRLPYRPPCLEVKEVTPEEFSVIFARDIFSSTK